MGHMAERKEGVSIMPLFPITDAQITEAIKIVRTGRSINEAADALGITRSVLSKTLKELGVRSAHHRKGDRGNRAKRERQLASDLLDDVLPTEKQ